MTGRGNPKRGRTVQCVLELPRALRTWGGVCVPVALRLLAVSPVRLPSASGPPSVRLRPPSVRLPPPPVHLPSAFRLSSAGGSCFQCVEPAPLTRGRGRKTTSFWQEGVPSTEEGEPREDVAASSLVASAGSTWAWDLQVTKVQEA